MAIVREAQMKLTRRDFGKIALAAVPARIDGVQIGIISYSFRDLPPATIVPNMVKLGLSEV